MKRRFVCAATGLCLAYGLLIVPASWAQITLTDAQLDFYAGRYNRVVDRLTIDIQKSPNDAPMNFLLGKSFYQLGEYSRAITNLERAVELSPNESEYHDWLGRSYGRKAEESVFITAIGLARKTHKEFETAVQDDPSNLEARRDLIRYEMNAPSIVGGGDDKAQKHIQDLERIDGVEGQLAQGEFFTTKNKLNEADAVFAKILESNPSRIGVYFEVADYYRDRPNPVKMDAAIAGADRIDPNDRRLKYYRGVLMVLSKGDPSEAAKLLRSYLTTVPNNSDLPSHASAREWLGKLYEAQGRFSEAAEEYRLSLSLDPHDKGVEEAYKRALKK